MAQIIKIFVLAGEASGDFLGASLIKQFKEKFSDKKLEFYCIGGPKMQQENVTLLYDSKEISYMGFFEVVPHLYSLIKKIHHTANFIKKLDPDYVITIDSPDFSFRVAKKIKNKIRGKLIHLVAPSVWAYREYRAKKIAKLYDLLLTILPFEPPYFEKYGLKTKFIGYPFFENIPKDISDIHFGQDKELITILLGSREQEVKRHLPVIKEFLAEASNNKRVFCFPLEERFVSFATSELKEFGNIIITSSEEDKWRYFKASSFAFAKSGTVTMELAYLNVPMIVFYKLNKLTYRIAKLLLKIKYINLTNIIANFLIIPELIQDEFNPYNLLHYLKNLDRKLQKTQLHAVMKELKTDHNPFAKAVEFCIED